MNPTWAMAIAASLGAALIHLALGPDHVEELGWLGLGFYVAAALQLGWAAAALRASRRIATAGIVINVAILAAWVISRTVGLPAGERPWTPEAIGRADGVAALLEGAVILALIRGLSGARSGPRAVSPFRRLAPTALAIVVIGAGTFVGLLPGGHAHGAGDVHGAGDHHGGTEVIAAERPVQPALKPVEQPAAGGEPAGVRPPAPTTAPEEAPTDADPEKEHADDGHAH